MEVDQIAPTTTIPKMGISQESNVNHLHCVRATNVKIVQSLRGLSTHRPRVHYLPSAHSLKLHHTSSIEFYPFCLRS
ncbi:hypothetical protein SCA6_007522 [Theobroma cacao]